MIGDVLRDLADFQQRRARKVLHRHHDMADVRGVLRNIAIAEIIEGGAELRRTGRGFRFAADRIEAEIRAANQHRSHLRMVRESNAAIRPRI